MKLTLLILTAGGLQLMAQLYDAGPRRIFPVTTLPATCAVGEIAFKTDASPGSNIYACTATNTWTVQAGSGSSGYTTTATAAGTTTLTSSSNKLQYFTGTTTQTVTLPVTSTLSLGFQFWITNNSTGVVTVNSSGGSAVQAMRAGSFAIYTVTLTSGTTAASWDVNYTGDNVKGPASAVQYTLALFDVISGVRIGPATGVTWDSTGGGRLTAIGGYNSGDGTTPSYSELPELTANGSESVKFTAADSQAANSSYQWPAVESTTRQVLRDSGTTVTKSGRVFRIWENATIPIEYFNWGLCVGTPCVTGTALTIEQKVEFTQTLTNCTIWAGTAPTGASLIVDILKAGTSIFGGGTKLVLAATAVDGDQNTIANAALTAGDKLTISITQVGSTIAGQNVGVKCWGI